MYTVRIPAKHADDCAQFFADHYYVAQRDYTIDTNDTITVNIIAESRWDEFESRWSWAFVHS